MSNPYYQLGLISPVPRDRKCHPLHAMLTFQMNTSDEPCGLITSLSPPRPSPPGPPGRGEETFRQPAYLRTRRGHWRDDLKSKLKKSLLILEKFSMILPVT